MTCFYFYLWDEQFGPAFIKVCAYFPYPIKIWLNGHHWAQRQAARAGLEVRPLSPGSNSFGSCADPAGLQEICDRLSPGTISVFGERWWARLPWPLGRADRAAGYWWECSMRQIEVSRTLVFDRPRNGRAFFDALVTDNLDLGRPDTFELIFGRQVRSTTTGVFATRVVTRGVDVTINAFYKHSRIKQCCKEGRALRIETVINNPTDLGVLRRLEHLEQLQAKARDLNRRLLDYQRVGQGTHLRGAGGVLEAVDVVRPVPPGLVDLSGLGGRHGGGTVHCVRGRRDISTQLPLDQGCGVDRRLGCGGRHRSVLALADGRMYDAKAARKAQAGRAAGSFPPPSPLPPPSPFPPSPFGLGDVVELPRPGPGLLRLP